ncbi:MAG: aldehyde dehydrogenase family protein [Alphaproteobacteria bacterium]|nr:aldehyde dehydrogenase family protein [Alphaproteobacteria bacterium]
MAGILRCISPIDGSVVAERPLATAADAASAVEAARRAQAGWRTVPLAQRMAICAAFAEHMVADKDRLGRDLTRQMGRPIRYTPGEIAGGMAERTRRMVELAPSALADVAASDKPGFTRFVRKEPLGVVFVVAPWNYPYLTAVNAIVPALVAGNAVILKHSHQTPLVAEAFRDGLARAGLPEGVFQVLHLGHAGTEALIGHPGVDFVAFTGSVQGGHAVTRAAKDRFIGLGLELGGKDPAYVRADCDLDHAVENLVDGAFFNSGQSCCGIERIYVHADVHDRFVDGFVALTRTYKLGDPLDPATTLGPMVRASAADFVRGQVAEAVAAGARSLVDPRHFPADAPGTPYLAPHVLVGVDHSMRVMTEESFGPVIGIMKVSSDEEAIRLMNDSAYGLTAAIWTADEDAALSIGARVETGTWFMNRCDYLDPELAWTGVKDSGRGCTLSRLGYDYLTRPKSFHLRTTTK